MTPAQELEAINCLSQCNALIAAGEDEAPIRSAFNSRLRNIAGLPTPWWTEEHIVKTEAALKARRGLRTATVFSDNLVGLTAIEYEKNLNLSTIFSTGYGQVEEYVAGLLNRGAPKASIRGVLSDTVRWFAYEIDTVSSTAIPGAISGRDITLRPSAILPSVDCSAANVTAAQLLHQFLETHLGRDGGQVLAPQPLIEMLGIDSSAGAKFVSQADHIVSTAFAANPGYALMVQNLWANFVSFVGTGGAALTFDKPSYVQELYLLTLAKLIAANVINGGALISDDPDLLEILDGRHFSSQGITNLVEYDYFGWLTRTPYSTPLVRLARDIQVALKAFDFSYLVPDDLFGPLVSQLSGSTQRILLGQAPTPRWLVKQMVDAISGNFTSVGQWRFIDPCCGSGAFVTEVISRHASDATFLAKRRVERGRALCETMMAFDVDPLAVMFAKVTWLIAAKPVLTPFNSGYPISIPIYHADSLFEITPLSRSVTSSVSGGFDLDLGGTIVRMPAFLMDPSNQAMFDEYTEALYGIAGHYAGLAKVSAVLTSEIANALTDALTRTGVTLTSIQQTEAETFGQKFCSELTRLERSGRNGLWLHMLKNGYRPAMVRNQFNALLTNFPWMALSSVTDNPYTLALKARARAYNIEPSVSARPHIDLATIFLLHAAQYYLDTNASIAAVVPHSVIAGDQHQPLRSETFQLTPSCIPLHVHEVWDVDKTAFSTNRAAVLICRMNRPGILSGKYSTNTGLTSYSLYLSTLSQKNAWTKTPIAARGAVNYQFEQGADIMPRTVWLHDVSLSPGPGTTTVAMVNPINSAAHPLWFLVAGAKKCKGFSARRCTISSDWAFKLLTSLLLLPFHINPAVSAILPFKPRKPGDRKIQPITAATMTRDRTAKVHFNRVFSALSVAGSGPTAGWGGTVDLDVAVRKLNERGKVMNQAFSPGDTLVLYGAGGAIPCAAKYYVSSSEADILIIDQELYWCVINDPDEADFIVGLINSSAMDEAIRPFQPQGINGRRHVHELPMQLLPAWNPANPKHLDVLSNSRALMRELAALATTDPILRSTLATPSANVNAPRQRIRAAIQSLPSYPAYEASCQLVV